MSGPKVCQLRRKKRKKEICSWCHYNAGFTIISDHVWFLGCFYDKYNPFRGTSAGAVRVLPYARWYQSDMTIGICINYCVKLENVRYAGVEDGYECWCGTSGAQYNLYGERNVSECSYPCAGNSNQTCGGHFRIAVYDREC